MKVLYDHQIFSWQKFGGVSRYFSELMAHFQKDPEVEIVLSLKYSDNVYLKNSEYSHHRAFLPGISFPGKRRATDLLDRLGSRSELKRSTFDIFHPTFYDPYFLDSLKGRPFVLTVYDMIHELFPQYFLKTAHVAKNKRFLISKAKAIIAISENTKKDIVRIYGTDPSKIEVVHLGSSLKPADNSFDPRIDLPERYLFFVGDRDNYKNFRAFITGIRSLMKADRQLFVVCAGGAGFRDDELKLFDKLGIKDRIRRYDLNDKMLALMYSRAIAFVFPSLYEGFGIPLLEAFTCGCPVIASNISSLPEVAGDAAEYFDPADECSILNAVSKVASDEVLRKALVKKGNERLKGFSWEKTADLTKKVYMRIK